MKAVPNVVVIGGGTGSFSVLHGLRDLPVSVTALVNMADDGGSTGQLRRDLGVLPPGDIRQCLVALARNTELATAFNYRYDGGHFKGHAFGNLFLAGLQKATGSFETAIEQAKRALDVQGTVLPITLSDVCLCMQTEADTQVVRGESAIDDMPFKIQRPKLWLEPAAVLNPRAAQAIIEADLIIVAPGGMYDSLAPALMTSGLSAALVAAKAPKLYVANLVTHPHKTDDFDVVDFATEIERFAGQPFIDIVLYNNAPLPPALGERYAQAEQFAVVFDADRAAGKAYKTIGADLVNDAVSFEQSANDPLAANRSLIRHDTHKLAVAIMQLLEA